MPESKEHYILSTKDENVSKEEDKRYYKKIKIKEKQLGRKLTEKELSGFWDEHEAEEWRKKNMPELKSRKEQLKGKIKVKSGVAKEMRPHRFPGKEGIFRRALKYIKKVK